MRVLIIEDDPMVAMIHKEYFKKKELTDDLSHVTSIEAAREYLENNDVDRAWDENLRLFFVF